MPLYDHIACTCISVACRYLVTHWLLKNNTLIERIVIICILYKASNFDNLIAIPIRLRIYFHNSVFLIMLSVLKNCITTCKLKRATFHYVKFNFVLTF